jgi:outer membrane protein assembly factor BamB
MLRARTLFVAALCGLALCAAVAAAYRALTSVSSIRPSDAWQPEAAGSPSLTTADWPVWRGARQDGIVQDSTLPTTWSATDGVAWSTDVPGLGHSSPVVCGDRVFVTTATVDPPSQSLLCYRLSDGQQLWNTPLHKGVLPKLHDKNSHASATPATDGRHVYTVFAVDDAVWASCVGLDGTIVWQVSPGPFISFWGYGSSPTLYNGLLIIAADNRGSKLNRLRATSFLAALNTTNGDVVWRRPRPEEHSFGTPIVATIADRAQLLLHGGGKVAGYAPETGDLLWETPTGIERSANSMTVDGMRLFCTGIYPDKEAMAIDIQKSENAFVAEPAWTTKKISCDVPSPIAADGRLLVLQDQGILACVNPADGELVWRKRLKGNFSASPLLSGGLLYVSNEEGVTTVVDVTDKGETLSENDLGEPIFASMVASGDRLLVRSLHHLWSIKNVSRQHER